MDLTERDRHRRVGIPWRRRRIRIRLPTSSVYAGFSIRRSPELVFPSPMNADRVLQPCVERARQSALARTSLHGKTIAAREALTRNEDAARLAEWATVRLLRVGAPNAESLARYPYLNLLFCDTVEHIRQRCKLVIVRESTHHTIITRTVRRTITSAGYVGLIANIETITMSGTMIGTVTITISGTVIVTDAANR